MGLLFKLRGLCSILIMGHLYVKRERWKEGQRFVNSLMSGSCPLDLMYIDVSIHLRWSL